MTDLGLSLRRTETERSKRSAWHVGRQIEKLFFLDRILIDLKVRGVQNILITYTDNLNVFTDTIRTIFPQLFTQTCVIHQIRNSCK